MKPDYPILSIKILVSRMGSDSDDFSFPGRKSLSFIPRERFVSCLSRMQEEVSRHYNRCMREMFITFASSNRLRQSDVTRCTKPVTPVLGAYIRNGLASKLAATFRRREMAFASARLPSANSSLPVPFSAGFSLGMTDREEFAVCLPLPSSFLGMEGKNIQVPLIVSTKSREKRVMRQRRKMGSDWHGKSTDEVVMGLKSGRYMSSYCEVFCRDGRIWISLSVKLRKAPCPECSSDMWTETKTTRCLSCHSTGKVVKEDEKGRKRTICEGCGESHFEPLYRCGSCGFKIYKGGLDELSIVGDGLDPAVTGGINFGVGKFACCATNSGDEHFIIGGSEIVNLNTEFAGRRWEMSRQSRVNRGGRGIKYKFRPYESMSRRMDEKRRTVIRQMAAEIVLFFSEQRASTVFMNSMRGVKDSPVPWNFFQMFQIRNVPYGEFIAAIKHALAKEGIASLFIDEKQSEGEKVDFFDFTSQLCHRCGHWNRHFTFQWRQENGFPPFRCSSCGREFDPDFNAAKRASMGADHIAAVEGIVARDE